MNHSSLEIAIYQLAADDLFRENRSDGSGWEWGWAPKQRDWMDATPGHAAYRCLPLTIVNQTGLWVLNPVGFEATWDGQEAPGHVTFAFDVAPEIWKSWISNHFGSGLVTWNSPLLIRSWPLGSRLLICGPVNVFKPDVAPLTALIESDWMNMSFTMNWKILPSGQPIRFEVGEPIFQVIPLACNVSKDIEMANVSYRKLADAPEVAAAYQTWTVGRQEFHRQQRDGEVGPHDWQKDYFQGRQPGIQGVDPNHHLKIRPPSVWTGPRPVAPEFL